MRPHLRRLRPVKLRLSFFYWMAGVVLLIALSLWVASWGVRVSQDWATLQQAPKVEPKTKFDASLDVVKAIVGGIGTIATIGGGVFVLWNLRLTQTRLITERFSKAVEQLGSDKIEVRLGGIYALERIAYDSDRDHWTIMEVLTSFIQEKSPIEEISEEQIRAKAYEIWQQSNGSGTEQEHWDTAIRALGKPVTKDVQAALTVVGRRQKKDPPHTILDLSEANLQRANLFGVNLQRANLFGVNLQRAVLSHTNLQQANLRRANLQQADLGEANLQFADLIRVNLQLADLSGANLSGAVLLATDLRYAKNFDPTQLGGEQQPLLCNVALPEGFPDKDRLKDRDCDQMSAALLKRYSDRFKSLEAAQKEVDKARQKKWE